ncbi:MAG: HAD-IA family hydrolase [bacterium]
MYKVISFDLDGTLVDSLQDIATCMNEVLIKNNMPTHSYEDYIGFIGEGAYRLVQKATNLKDVDLYFNQYQELAIVKCTEKAKEFPNVTSTLLKLKENYKIALITNKPIDQGKKIVDLFFPNIFDYVCGQEEGVAKKPDVEPMDKLLKYFNVSKEEVLYVGDSHIDYQFAKNCDVDVLILSYGYSSKEFKLSIENECLIDNFEEILKNLK